MNSISIEGRQIGPAHPAYIIAEISANHGSRFEEAQRLVEAAKEAGADAVKLQTYTAATITLNCDRPEFQIEGTIWAGRKLYDLYEEAHTPWEWQPRLKAYAESLGLHCFSSPFDFTAVDFLEALDVPAYKIASFELVDLPLIQKVAQTGKPMILSTGMATLAEIHEAVTAAREAGATQIGLLKCTSGYPAAPEEMNLRTIPHLAEAFGVVVGLSDHTLGSAVPIAAMTLGASIIEKHITMSRSVPGPDSAFSLEPNEFKKMVEEIRMTERALGRVCYSVTDGEVASRVFRRSLFVVADMRAGETFSDANVRSIRPGHGLAPRHLGAVLGRKAAVDLTAGTPLSWSLVS
jgi:pseudaminic acid synthase